MDELAAMGGAAGAAAERSVRELYDRAQRWKVEQGSALVER